MKTVVFASRNRGKIREIRALLEGLPISLRSLDDFPDAPDVEEDGDTFWANARKKALAIARHTGCAALADDSGLTVAALGGAPGVHSARYAGENADDAKNIDKLLRVMKDIPKERRNAAFRCVLVLCEPDGSCESFEGAWDGRIAETPDGDGGFGYDPVFYVPALGKTVARLSLEEKNRLSHRARAFGRFREALERRFQNR
ncbi:MAG: non-canonical purine NTP pyrophosphatase [Deltaproteobacteria bacterium HGW-Deltaproteobacteria-19]|nr:MAG: non-canonical purine NTP pyrophosphatase [Deltaproteobacteria bacterium HGW-Deltaproteobacteria-19]